MGRHVLYGGRAGNTGDALRRSLYVLHQPVFGGPHNQVLRLAAPLAERGWLTTVVVPTEPGNAAARLEGAGLDVVRVPLHRSRATTDPRVHFRMARSFPREVRSLRRLIKRKQVNLVVIGGGLLNPHAAVAGHLEDVPVVWQIIDTRTPPLLRRIAMPVVLRLAEVVMTTGVTVANVHPGTASLGDRLIPFFPPVDVDLFAPDGRRRQAARHELGIRPGALVVGNVSTLSPMKGHGMFLDAAMALRQQGIDAVFVILGETPDTHRSYAKQLLEMATAAGMVLGEDLIIRAPEDKVAYLEQAFDYFWLTSEPLSEGVPTAVIEAMALSLPVVATDVGGVREIVNHGVTGLLVPPGDADALATATLQLIGDAQRRIEFGRAARAFAEARCSALASTQTHLRAFELAVSRR